MLPKFVNMVLKDSNGRPGGEFNGLDSDGDSVGSVGRAEWVSDEAVDVNIETLLRISLEEQVCQYIANLCLLNYYQNLPAINHLHRINIKKAFVALRGILTEVHESGGEPCRTAHVLSPDLSPSKISLSQSRNSGVGLGHT